SGFGKRCTACFSDGISTVGVALPQVGVEHEHESQPPFQWAVKQRHLSPRWHDRHFPQDGLQPQSEAVVVQVTGVEQPQETLEEHELQPQCPKMPPNIPQPEPQPLPQPPLPLSKAQ